MAGYSNTPLAKKLGFKDGNRILLVHAPANYMQLLGERPGNLIVSGRLKTDIDTCHFFTRSAIELATRLPKLKIAIRQSGAIWISWPKKAAKLRTDITEDRIRAIALPLGLVDIKVCAIDDTWSGLKLVIRRELRK
jgi:hypothetical protein